MQAYQGYPTGQVDHAAGSWSQVPIAQQQVKVAQHVQHVAQAPVPSPLDAAAWLVYVEGGEVVGPVSANQIARGMRAGRVPTDASIQAQGEVFWTGLLDEPAIIAALKSV